MEIPKDILYPKINKPVCKTFLVGGPPGSGKSTFVKANAKAKDIIIDLDEIMAKLSGMSLYQSNHDEWIIKALQERNRLINSLSMVDIINNSMVIIYRRRYSMGMVERNLKANNVHSCWCPIDICKLRIRNDKEGLMI
jgi:predicted kinase